MVSSEFYEYDEKERLLARVSWLYYSAGFTQQAVADQLGLNRVRVNKLLAEAREKGIITFQINVPYTNEFKLEKELADKYQLENVIIGPTPDNEEDMKKVLGQAAANYLDKILTEDDILATAWGTTLYQVANWLKPRQKLSELVITQLTGALSNNPPQTNPLNIARIISEKYSAIYERLFAPLFVENKSIRAALLSDENIKRKLNLASSATKALVGVGPVKLESTFVEAGYLKPDFIEVLKEKGAVGDIVGRYFDINGNPVGGEVDERVVSLELSDIKAIDMVIGVAGGSSKVQAIRGALKGGLLDVLVTDEETAQRILKEEDL